MKRVLTVLFALAITFSLSACGTTLDDLPPSDLMIPSHVSTTDDTSETTRRESIRKNHDGMEQSYEALQQELEDALARRDYPSTANELFRQILEDLYNNYEGWTLRSFGMPEKHDYIRANLIDAIDVLSTISFYEDGSEESNHLRDLGTFAASYASGLEFAYVPEKDENGRFRAFDEATFYHEIQHCLQNAEDLFNIFGEGGATFHMRLVKPCGMDFNSGSYVCKCFEYKNDFAGGGYSLYGNLFTKLVCFAGYETVEEVEYGAPITQIRTALANKYGEDLAGEIMSSLKIINSADEMETENADLLFSLEQNFLECLETDIRELNSAEEVCRYAEFFRYYKALLCPEISEYAEKIWEDSPDLTEECLAMDIAENLLVDKIVEYHAMDFAEDDALHRMAVHAALIASEEAYKSNYSFLLPPTDIMHTSYLYEEAGETGKLYMQYFNDSEEREFQICVTFDADSILYSAEPGPYKEGLNQQLN